MRGPTAQLTRSTVIGVFVGILALVSWYRWTMNRRRDRAAATSMAQTSGPILPIIRLPNSDDIARHPVTSQQSYLGENLPGAFNRERREPPPAYHGKEPLEGETVISTNAPPETETPPAYVTSALTPPPPAYMRNEVSSKSNTWVASDARHRVHTGNKSVHARLYNALDHAPSSMSNG